MSKNALDQAQAEITGLEKKIYLDGHWSCPKCKFYLVSTSFYVGDGSMAPNTEPQQCANGCGPMWRVTHEQSANTMVDRCEAQTLRIEQLEAIRDAAESAYSELAFAVHDLAGRRLYTDSDIDRRSEKLAKCADELRVALDAVPQSAGDNAPEDDWRLYECSACGWQVQAIPTELKKRGSMTCSQCGYGNLRETVEK